MAAAHSSLVFGHGAALPHMFSLADTKLHYIAIPKTLNFNSQGLEVDPAHIFLASGCGAVLSTMFNLLGEAGESVLIPAPYYPGFDFDTQVQHRV